MSELHTLLHYGRVHARVKGSTLPPFQLGPMRALGVNIEQNEIVIKDPRTITDSELDGVSRPSGGTVQGELLEFPPETLVALLNANRTEVPTGTATDEAHAAMVGRTSMTFRLPLAITSVKSADDVTTYVAGTDYVKTPGGVQWLDGGDLAADIAAAVADADGNKSVPVKVTYTYPTINLIQAFKRGRQYYEVFVETMNEAGQLNGRRVTFRRARMALGGDLPLINRDEFAVIPVTFTLSEDPNYFGSDESGLMVWEEEVVTG